MNTFNKALASTFATCAVLAGMVMFGVSQMVPAAHAHPVTPSIQHNPNPARILNRTTVNTEDGKKELVTVETLPGLVCVITSASNINGTNTSCVSYRP